MRSTGVARTLFLLALGAAFLLVSELQRGGWGAAHPAWPVHERAHDGYVSSSACRPCHPAQYASWHRSFHRTMTQRANPRTLLGRLEDIPGGAQSDAADIVTGSHHMQVAWARSGDRWTALPWAYLRAEGRWVARENVFLGPPGEHQDETTWNASCLFCHATGVQPRFDAQEGRFDSTVAELGIACEACHGPGLAHVRANQNPLRRYATHLTASGDATIINPAKLGAERASQTCGQCHAITARLMDPELTRQGPRYRPGDDLFRTQPLERPAHADRQPWLAEMLRADPDYLRSSYWPDGACRVSGRDLNALVESKCYRSGKLSCSSCHSMHQSAPENQLAADASSDARCLQCHASMRDRPSAHTHHAAASSGSRCYNCHMPYTSYGLLKAIRSHRIGSPSVKESVEVGRPNACNLCHLDRTLAWTQEQLARWYGQSAVALDAEQRTVPAAARWMLAGDAFQRVIVAWHIGWPDAQRAAGTEWLAPIVAELLDDSYAAVRYVAFHALRRLPGYGDLAYDYVGPPEQRRAARERVYARWRERGRESIDGLDASSLRELLGRRDDTPIHSME
jgi:predicted CXXCH cytochrome family protein